MIFLSCDIEEQNEEGLNFHLTTNYVDPYDYVSGKIKLDDISYSGKPFISDNEIVMYDSGGRVFTITTTAYLRLQEEAEVNLRSGIAFVAAVNKKLIYIGWIVSGFSSNTCPGIVIRNPKEDSSGVVNEMKVELGYPSSKFFVGLDERNHPTIITVLKKKGKINR